MTRWRACAFKRGGSRGGEPNKTEARYLQYCKLHVACGIFQSYIFHGHQFWLPGRVPFLPDVEVIHHDGEIWQVDVKAGNRKTGKALITEASRNKIRAAVEAFPHYRWFIAYEIGGNWHHEEF